ncbi:MAG: tetratricopeptide repeat protein [bacterium]|nr:tetratricopeptide repeat protein [bacterium]
MRTLDVFDLEARSFFGQALDIVSTPERFLAEFEQTGEMEPALRRIVRITPTLDRDPVGETVQEKVLLEEPAETLVADVAGRPRAEQRRALRSARKLRHSAFAQAYLDHLDALRYRRPKEAARLAETVATDLVPRLSCPRERRLSLQCRAIGVFGSSHRIMEGFPTAARATRFALDLARKHELATSTAELLQRGSYVLSDYGLFNRALLFLREALEIYFDRELRFGIGKTLVDRGIMFHYAGSYQDAVRALRRALHYFPERGPGLERNLQAVYHHLALVYTSLGDFGAAESWLREASDTLADDGGIPEARLAWHQGKILFAKGEHHAAEKRFRQACEIFENRGEPDGVLASLDLLKALLARGRAQEAQRIAVEMVTQLMRYRGTRINEETWNEFVRAGVDGEITPSLIDRIESRLRKTGAGGEVPSTS